MRIRELLPAAVAVGCACTFTYLTVSRATQDARSASSSPAPILLPVKSQEVIGTRPSFFGNAKASYTLVEFADYQCPPCGEMSRNLPDTLAPFAGQLRLTFRNFPLQDLHKQAIQAAIVAEAARAQGRFWPVHDALYEHQQDLSRNTLVSIVKQHHLDRRKFESACVTTARTALADDMRCADKLRLTATPTFILCCADGRVVRLGSINQLSEYIKP